MKIQIGKKKYCLVLKLERQATKMSVRIMFGDKKQLTNEEAQENIAKQMRRHLMAPCKRRESIIGRENALKYTAAAAAAAAATTIPTITTKHPVCF